LEELPACSHECSPDVVAVPAEWSGNELAADLPAAGGAGGAGADGGVGGADGDASSAPLPWWPHCGQVHSTVHLRTGTSFVTGYFTNLRDS